ncbi:MAG: hypothetical protein HYZ65_08790 [Burkholderiales bacterium]|nr:hypothetical protein [Burkholderiales bacterium]
MGANKKNGVSKIMPDKGEVHRAGAVEDAAAAESASEPVLSAPASDVALGAPTLPDPLPAQLPPVMPSVLAHELEKNHTALRLQQAAALMAQVKKEAGELTADERRHLDSHVLANALHGINEQCFNEVDSFKQFNITFYNLRANSKAFLSIRPDQNAIWSEGDKTSGMIGLSFATSTAPALYLRNFLINAREMFLETYQDCSEINIGLYVRTNQQQLQGRVDLPPGASVTMQSRCDRSNLIGLSSFAVDLG